jgi:hypothetical protein
MVWPIIALLLTVLRALAEIPVTVRQIGRS